MEIYDFDIKKGIYSFQFDDLQTESHAHPVVEIVTATNGTFSLHSNGHMQENLVFAIINSAVTHKVVSKNCTLKIAMIESYNSRLSDFFDSYGIAFKDGVFQSTVFSKKDQLFLEAKRLATEKDLKTPADDRIKDSILFMEENELDYKNLMAELRSRAYLSDSRLSHLFKEHIGVSIKKYLVWDRLRKAIQLYLNQHTNLTDVSLQSGFFDQAHLSNSFKSVLGVSPSTAYNSRIIQS